MKQKILFISYYELKEALLDAASALKSEYHIIHYPLFRYAHDVNCKIDHYVAHLSMYIQHKKPAAVLWWYIGIPSEEILGIKEDNPNVPFLFFSWNIPDPFKGAYEKCFDHQFLQYNPERVGRPFAGSYLLPGPTNTESPEYLDVYNKLKKLENVDICFFLFKPLDAHTIQYIQYCRQYAISFRVVGHASAAVFPEYAGPIQYYTTPIFTQKSRVQILGCFSDYPENISQTEINVTGAGGHPHKVADIKLPSDIPYLLQKVSETPPKTSWAEWANAITTQLRTMALPKPTVGLETPEHMTSVDMFSLLNTLNNIHIHKDVSENTRALEFFLDTHPGVDLMYWIEYFNGC